MAKSIKYTDDDIAKFKTLFSYYNGKLYHMKSYKRIKAGDEAGTKLANSYRRVEVLGKKIYRHRLVWMLHYGPIPDGYEVDHINDVAGDDRIENLQLLSIKNNVRKSAISLNIPKNNTSGVKGVSWNKKGKRWYACINSAGRLIGLGYHTTLLDAVAARLRAERELYSDLMVK